jgi:hypothetical protein
MPDHLTKSSIDNSLGKTNLIPANLCYALYFGRLGSFSLENPWMASEVVSVGCGKLRTKRLEDAAIASFDNRYRNQVYSF